MTRMLHSLLADSVGDLARRPRPGRLRHRRQATNPPSWPPERLYAEAKEEAAAGNYEKAIKLYERLEGRAAGTVLAQQAQLERAYLLWKTGEKAQALSTLERFIKLHPTSPALDYALYLQGLVNFNDNLGILRHAGAPGPVRARPAGVARLVPVVPASSSSSSRSRSYAEDARLRMNYIVNSLAAYEVHVARYYFRRGAYVAAANRAQQAVQEFQQLAVDRGSALHHGAELRPPRPDPAARRRRPGAADELPEHADLRRTAWATSRRRGGSSGEPAALRR